MGPFRSNLFVPSWRPEILFRSLVVVFRDRVCLLRWPFFASEASWGKVLTLDQFQRRGFFLTNRCFFCLSEVEMVDHLLLLHCARSRVFWDLLFSLFGVSWILSCSVKETLLGSHGSFVGKSCKKAWQAALLCIFWIAWNERNLIVFDNEGLSIQRLKNSFVCNLWSWFRVFVDMCPVSLVSFIDWLGSK